MIIERAGLRRNEVAQAEKLIKSGGTPLDVARQFRLQLPVVVEMFEMYGVDPGDYKDMVDDPSRLSATQLAIDNVALKHLVKKSEERLAAKDEEIDQLKETVDSDVLAKLEDKDKTIERLKLQISDMEKKFLSPAEKKQIKETGGN